MIISCDPTIEQQNRTELCDQLSQEYTNCIIQYCEEVAPSYSWEMFFDELNTVINRQCISGTSKIYSEKFLKCFYVHTCKDILMFDKCKINLQAQNYCGVQQLSRNINSNWNPGSA